MYDPVPLATTLVELLEDRASAPAGGYTFATGGSEARELSFSQLALQARAIAVRLRMDTRPGSRAVLLYPPGANFLAAFFGCLYAGIIAVPLPSPERARLKRSLPRMRTILDDAAPTLILCPATIAEALQPPLADALPQLRWMTTDTVAAELGTQWRVCTQRSEDVAYLQYTSGSTTSPRGVMITHANVMRNLHCFGRAMNYDAGSVEVTWMPHFHDYGLVGGLLHPLYCNICAHILSPLTVAKRPLQWLQTITEQRGTHSHAPNFAYELCAQRVTSDQKRSLDLSRWKTAGNGAEPVRADTLRRFAEAFACCGFDPNSFYPAYGLAEATLFVTARKQGAVYRTLKVDAGALAQHRVVVVDEGDASNISRLLVSCGVPADGSDLRIVDPTTGIARQPDCVGEIWFADQSVARGYWGDDNETRSSFAAQLSEDSSAGPFLRTGDLGFLHDGELFVTGRLKEMIVVAGANHYPQDIEWSVQASCPEIRRDHCAAFAIERNGTEQVAIVAEPEGRQCDWPELMRRIRTIVWSEHGLPVAAIAILPRGGVFRTSSGKVQRSACRDAFRDGTLAPLAMWAAGDASDITIRERGSGDLERWICGALADAVRRDPAMIDINTPFAEYGLDSRAAVAFVGLLEDRLGCGELSATLLWEFPSIASLLAHLFERKSDKPVRALTAANADPIAIVGAACRFPGAADLEAFWDLLRDGRSAVGPSTRLPGVVGGFLPSIDGFDASFFGVSPSEAEVMDPQQRLLLEVVWAALEHAGIDPHALRGSAAGVFVGISGADHGFVQLGQPAGEQAITAHTGTGLAFSIAANRLSYLLDLRGPSMAIDTACSSSLVAVHQACRSLRHGECQIALAAGVNLILSSRLHLAIERAGMLSSEGRCKTFDEDADGYVRGEGCGVVVLKRWTDAMLDGDAVLGLIRASAINQDGRSNGLTAPNPGAQQQLIQQALTEAGLAPSDIGYVEAHGTGTRLGDPIEVGALRAVLGLGRTSENPCWIGSVKTNIGHLEAAAGIAGLIKALLVLHHGQIVPHLNLRKLNPLLRLEGTPFRIATANERWDAAGSGARYAAVSSFGFGGTNAHIILEAPSSSAGVEATVVRPPYLLILSAATAQALNAVAAHYSDWLARHPDIPLGDVCFTAATGRAHLSQRLAVAASDANAMRAALDTRDSVPGATVYRGGSASNRPRLAFLFSGQGSQYAGMGRGLYETEPVFRDALDECDGLLRDELPRALLSVMWSPATGELDQTVYTQPALFAVEYALARLWQAWGVEPTALIGHSIGEYVAACLAGVFELADGLRLVAARGRLMQSLPPGGGMLAVRASEHALTKFLAAEAISANRISLAAVNAPYSCVLSGDRAELERLQPRLEAEGLATTFLRVSHAFHSMWMGPILDEFHRIASRIRHRSPQVTLIGNLDGRPLAAAPDAEYWTRHLRNTVRFAEGVTALGASCDVFVEIGPRPALCGLAAQCITDRDLRFVPSLRPGCEDRAAMVEALAQLHTAGVKANWAGFYRGGDCRRVPGLPQYPFERQQFRLPISAPSCDDYATAPIEQWGFAGHWLEVDAAREDDAVHWLIFSDRRGVGSALQSVAVKRGDSCAAAVEALPHSTRPAQVIYLQALDWPDAAALDETTLPDALATQFSRLVAVVGDLASQGRRAIQLCLVTRDAVSGPNGAGGEGLLQNLVWGIGRTLRREYPDWQVRLIDLDAATEPRHAAQQLLTECVAREKWPDVCWRNERRYALRLRPEPLVAHSDAAPLHGSWLVTGGLGRIGVRVAERLVRNGAARVVLAGRRRPGAEVAAVLDVLARSSHPIETRVVDVTDFSALRLLLSELSDSSPRLEGIIHAAGVFDDGLLHQQSAERLQAILAPKVLGTWYLHLLTRSLPLRHFILFSSAASLLGNPGQSTYAAANAFLDGLAWYRRAQNLPAASINWSAWSNIAGNPRVAKSLERDGLMTISEEAGVEAFARTLTIDAPQIAVLPTRRGQLLDLPKPLVLEALPLRTAGSLLEMLKPLPARARAGRLGAYILGLAATVSGVERSALRSDLGFFQQGLDSLHAVELRNRLQSDLDRPLPITLPFDFPTASALALELVRQLELDGTEPEATPVPRRSSRERCDIAIIGLGCRMPGCLNGVDPFWRLLRDGVDAITETPPDRWEIDRLYHPDPGHPGTIVTRNGGFVEAVHWFDAAFFGISPREAQQLDPQQRLLLEVCWETFEHAGVPPSKLVGSPTGVFIGISTNDYVYRLAREPERIDGYFGTGNALSIAANRLSYVFGLEGPSLAIDTACSSSLVAIHQACLSLREGECDLAIAGGVNLMLDPAISINHSRARMLAPDGRCKAFSAAADGYVRSEGCGLVLLKRLPEAQRDEDPILAVIRGSAVNQDGRSAGLTAPNGRAQQRVIRRALQQAELTPAEISYVETHGTGTPLGDPIEIAALTEVFQSDRRELAIGSVKTNIGHLEAAAGIAGLLKVVLALKHGMLPAHLHCSVVSPKINWSETPIRICHKTASWPSEAVPRRAGISSFGFGGTNAHVVVEEAPPSPARRHARSGSQLLTLSAKTETALRLLVEEMATFLATTGEALADICFTATFCRDHFAHRLAVIGGDRVALAADLRAWLAGDTPAAAWCGVAREAEWNASAPVASDLTCEELATCYVHGADPDWRAHYDDASPRRVVIPGHPFERQHYSVDPPPVSRGKADLFRLHWVDSAASRRPAAGLGDRWLVLADRAGWGEAIANELTTRGAGCSLIYRNPVEPGWAGAALDTARLAQLLTELQPLAGVLYLFPLDCPPADALRPDTLSGVSREDGALVPELIRGLQNLPVPPRLWIVTRAAQAALPGDRLEGLAQAPLWGLGRTLALELPGLWGGLVDLPPDPPTSHAASLVADLLYGTAQDKQAAIRGGRILALRMAPCSVPPGTSVEIRPKGGYLVSGGFGSVGRTFARWLVQKGARHIWLIGRGGPTDANSRNFVGDLRRQGVAVEAASLDVADAEQLATQLAAWRRNGPPLRGVIHAAGSNAESPAAALEWPALAALLPGKVQGGLALAQLTADAELDFFLSISSIAALWGSRHQAGYAWANAFLHGLSAWQRARNVAALTIDFGPLDGSTMLHDAAAQELGQLGLLPMPLSRACAAADALLCLGVAQAAVVRADWPRFSELYRSRCPTGLFDAILQDNATISAGLRNHGNAHADHGISSRNLRAYFTGALGATLQLPPEGIDPDIPLPRLGLDSLGALDLRDRLKRALGVELPLPDLLGEYSLNTLLDHIGASPVKAGGPVWVTGEL